MGWEVRLSGVAADLDILAQSFTGPEYVISKRGDEYLLTSPEFEDLNDYHKILDRAAAIVDLINGAGKLSLDFLAPVAFGGVTYLHEDGTRTAYMSAELTERWTVRVLATTLIREDGSEETYHAADHVREWVKLASSDCEVEKVLSLLAPGKCDWVNLYRVFEIVAADIGGLDNIEAEGWATSKAMRLFKHTANSPDAVGTEARHGTQPSAPPAKPMSIEVAKSLILGIVQSWLNGKTTLP